MPSVVIELVNGSIAAVYQNRRKTPCFNYGDIRR